MNNAVPVILVTDDDDGIRNLLASFLESSGYRVLQACDGSEALALWTSHHTEIDLLITDIEMPKMSGIELIHQLNRSHAAVPVLIISGSSATLEVCALSGTNVPIPILSKPFDLRALGQVVTALIRAAIRPAPDRVPAVS